MHASKEGIKEATEQPADNNPWDKLREVDFAGEFQSQPEPEQVKQEKNPEAAAREIRELTDWRAKAERENPDGLADAIAQDTAINTAREHERQVARNGVARYEELSSTTGARQQRRRELQLLQDEKAGSKTYRLKQKFGIQDRQMTDWQRELGEIEALEREKISLAYSGYGNEESVERRIAAIGADTHEQEETFIDSFVQPLEKEQKKELLNFDNLAKLSTREYLNLWKGLNPYYASHATRQGYRDHTGTVYHTAGLGEFHDGCKQILNSDKRLHSVWETATGTEMSDVGKEGVVDKYLEHATKLSEWIPKDLLEGELDEAALASYLGGAHNILNRPDGYWQDRTSIHFLANAVGDSLYGAEEGNEVFFVFPADVLASQCYYDKPLGGRASGRDRGKGKAPRQSDGEHNDYFVMSRENGIPIDAGLVFLPKNVFVNPENGSKYLKYDDENPVYASEESGMRAEEYWEQYFTEHPEARPAHVIYYDGKPADAVNDLLEKEGILVGGAGDLAEGKDFYDCGFGEHLVFGGTEADQQVAAERQTFFKHMADYITRKYRS